MTCFRGVCACMHDSLCVVVENGVTHAHAVCDSFLSSSAAEPNRREARHRQQAVSTQTRSTAPCRGSLGAFASASLTAVL